LYVLLPKQYHSYCKAKELNFRTLKRYFFIILLFLITQYFAKAQNNKDNDLVQFSGFVLSYDSTRTVPYATIRISGSYRGTYSDMSGYFSFVAKKTDTVVFSSIGFKYKAFLFPTNLQSSKFNTVIALEEDTFYLPEYVIKPYPTLQEFDYYFVKTKIPDDELSIAYSNLRRKPLADFSNNMSYDAKEAGRWTTSQQALQQSYTGQVTPIKILDPFAWGKFIKAIESGDFNRK